MPTKKIAFIGECMIELRNLEGLYQPAYGGDTLNSAIYLARLRKECDVSYITGLGSDEFSRLMLQGWAEERINTEHVVILNDKQPGLYTITNLPSGEREFRYWRNDSAARYWLRFIDPTAFTDTLKTFDLIYLSGISLAILPDDCREVLFNMLNQCQHAGVTIAFDNNYRPALWPSVEAARSAYRQMLTCTDWAFLTLDDETALYGDRDIEAVIKETLAQGVKEVIIKHGSEDCIVGTENHRYTQAPDKVAKVIDTTAAGDSFSAGYLSQRLYSDDIDAAIRAGHTLAGTVIQHKGAIIDRAAMPEL